MEAVNVSPKYQVVILKSVRERLKPAPGQKVQVLAYDNRIELIPLRNLQDMRGFLPGLDSDIPRDRDRV